MNEKMKLDKLREILRRGLERGFNLFEGSGIGKIPGVSRLFSYMSSFAGTSYIEVDGQKLCTILYHKPEIHLLYYSNEQEPLVSSLFCSMLEEGMVVVDVGASLGYYTLLAAKRVGDGGRVISFEPDPLRYERLLKSIQINGWKNVKAFNLAVSDTGKSMILRIQKIEGEGIINVNAVDLDSFLQTDPDIIKIDVEGAELEVLRGTEKILAKGKVKIICEVHPDLLSSLGYSTKEIEDFLRQYNYNIYLIGEKGLVPATSISNKREHYLFTKDKVMWKSSNGI